MRLNAMVRSTVAVNRTTSVVFTSKPLYRAEQPEPPSA
jgi:hypothetical protein